MTTPRSRIQGMLRQIFLRSKERQAALQKTNYCCAECGIKKTAKKGQEVKLNVHHVDGIDIWDEVIELIYTKLLCRDNPEKLKPLCTDCHYNEHH